jgi:hypothetical protein
MNNNGMSKIMLNYKLMDEYDVRPLERLLDETETALVTDDDDDVARK